MYKTIVSLAVVVLPVVAIFAIKAYRRKHPAMTEAGLGHMLAEGIVPYKSWPPGLFKRLLGFIRNGEAVIRKDSLTGGLVIHTEAVAVTIIHKRHGRMQILRQLRNNTGDPWNDALHTLVNATLLVHPLKSDHPDEIAYQLIAVQLGERYTRFKDRERLNLQVGAPEPLDIVSKSYVGMFQRILVRHYFVELPPNGQGEGMYQHQYECPLDNGKVAIFKWELSGKVPA